MVGSFDASVGVVCCVFSRWRVFMTCVAQGMVMGIASPSGHVMLYDPVSAAQDPFTQKHVVEFLSMEQKGVDWADMQFSDDDQYLALAYDHGIVLLDALDLAEVG
jgi:hypothetical protein